jgi:hypothetical protein
MDVTPRPIDSRVRLASSIQMSDTRKFTVRYVAAALLSIALTLTSVGRGLMAAPDVSSVTTAGMVAPICHARLGDAESPGPPSRHDCCDECALSAPIVMPAAPAVSAPTRMVLALQLGALASPIPHLARARSPRQSQGPPPIA